MLNTKKWMAGITLAALALTVGACAVSTEEGAPQAGESAEETVGKVSEELRFCTNSLQLCPFGYSRIGPAYCTFACGPCNGPFPAPNAIDCYYNGPYGSVTASPTNVRIAPGVLGTSRICASATISNSEVWVTMDGVGESLFSRGSLCQDAPWIQIGHSYEFKLYVGTAHASVLSRVTVRGTAIDNGGGGGSCSSCSSGTSCHCGDEVCRPNNSDCP